MKLGLIEAVKYTILNSHEKKSLSYDDSYDTLLNYVAMAMVFMQEQNIAPEFEEWFAALKLDAEIESKVILKKDSEKGMFSKEEILEYCKTEIESVIKQLDELRKDNELRPDIKLVHARTLNNQLRFYRSIEHYIQEPEVIDIDLEE